MPSQEGQTPWTSPFRPSRERSPKRPAHFEEKQTGHAPVSVTVVFSGETLVVTLHGSLSPAEQALAKSPGGTAQVQEFHRQLFADSAGTLRQEIKRITGVEVREATAEIEPTTGTVVKVFTTGTKVQVFLLARGVPADSWSGDELNVPLSMKRKEGSL